MSEHNWKLKGGARIETSSYLPTDVAMFQCEACGVCATRRLNNRHESKSAVIDFPEVEARCEE